MKRIHFIGIGGIGISGLALYMHAQGHKISGSDIAPNKITKKLANMGIEIFIPHEARAISNQDMVIHSAIINESNPEIKEASAQGIKIYSRKEALKFILAQKRVFSVCGAHGKSSTSAMLSSILPFFGAIIGAESKEFNSNVRQLASEGLVFEADESDKSFLNSNPSCAIITNTEPEHMECYNHDVTQLERAYMKFIQKSSYAVLNAQDPFLARLLESNKLNGIEVARLDPKSDVKNIEFFLKDSEPFVRFELAELGEFEVWGIGEHIAHNAALAILAGLSILSPEEVRANLKNYKGIRKRFDIIQKANPIIIDDYAHHPTEIIATLKSLRAYARLRDESHITVIWQPHKCSRLRDNLDAFQGCFELCDELVILPIWSVNEEKIDFDMEALFARYKPTFATSILRQDEKVHLLLDGKIISTLESGIIIGMGAGDITTQLRAT